MEFVNMPDPCAIDVKKDGETIASIQWHEENLRLVFCKSFRHLTHAELRRIMDKMKEVQEKGFKK
jgi:hypothetical protein